MILLGKELVHKNRIEGTTLKIDIPMGRNRILHDQGHYGSEIICEEIVFELTHLPHPLPPGSPAFRKPGSRRIGLKTGK